MAEILLRRRLPLETPGDGVNVVLGFLIDDTNGRLLGVGGRNNSPDTFHIRANVGDRDFRTTLSPGEDWRRQVPGANLFCTQRPDGRWRLPFDTHSIERVLAVPLIGSPTVLSVTTTITFSAASGTSHVFNLPATVDAGDGLVCLIGGSIEITGWSPPAGGWVEIGEGGTTMRTAGFGLAAAGSEDGGSATATSTGAGAAVAHTLRLQAGTWSGDPADLEMAFASGESANPDPPNITPSHGEQDYLLIAGVNVGNDGAFSDDPDGYANASDDTAESADNQDVQFRIVRRAATVSSENPTTFTWFESEVWTAFTLAVPPQLVFVEWDQEGYRFRNDDGDEDGATWISAQDVPLHPSLTAASASGTGVETPRSAGNVITGNIFIAAYIRPGSADKTECIVGRFGLVSTPLDGLVFSFMTRNDGALLFSWSDDGTGDTDTDVASTVQWSSGSHSIPIAPDQAFWAGVAHDPDDGAGSRTTTFYAAPTRELLLANQLGTPVTWGNDGAFPDPTDIPYCVGSRLSGGFQFQGDIYEVEVYEGLNFSGTRKLNPNFGDGGQGWSPGDGPSDTGTDDHGNVWTIGTNFSIVGGHNPEDPFRLRVLMDAVDDPGSVPMTLQYKRSDEADSEWRNV